MAQALEHEYLSPDKHKDKKKKKKKENAKAEKTDKAESVDAAEKGEKVEKVGVRLAVLVRFIHACATAVDCCHCVAVCLNARRSNMAQINTMVRNSLGCGV